MSIKKKVIPAEKEVKKEEIHIVTILLNKNPLSPFLCQQFFKFHGYEIQKLIFYTVIRKHFKLGLGNMDTGLEVKEKLLSTELDF